MLQTKQNPPKGHSRKVGFLISLAIAGIFASIIGLILMEQHKTVATRAADAPRIGHGGVVLSELDVPEYKNNQAEETDWQDGVASVSSSIRRKLSRVKTTTTTSAPTPVPTTSSNPTQTAVAPAPAPAAVTAGPSKLVVPIGFSMAEELIGLPDKDLNLWLDDMVSLGATWVRMDFDWSWLQPTQGGKIDWTKIDRVVFALRAHNINVLPILDYTPVWARTDACSYTSRCAPKNPADFAAFAKEASTRYAPYGVHTWEIWNEQNMRGSWQPAASAAGYTALLKSAYVGIKSVDPSAVVVSGGLGPTATANGDVAPVEYVQQMYDAGAQNYFDALGFHPYSFPVWATYYEPWNAWQQMMATPVNVRQIMVAHGDSAKKIWITEYGAPTNGPGIGADSTNQHLTEHPDHVTEELQAKIATDAITAIQKYSWAGPLFWYSYKDIGTQPTSIENFFGILRNDGSQKPVYQAIKNLQ